jgi:type VI secretion system protein VasD
MARHLRRSLLTALALLAPACAHKPPEPCKAEPLRLSIEAAPQVNLDDKGRPLPTTLRIYQLKDTAKLEAATFNDLLENDKDTLATDLVAAQEVVINPGEKIEPPIQRKEEADFIGVMALFRNPAGNFWRLARPLTPVDPGHCHKAGRPAGLRFHLEENRVENR